jgi:hypothetical protein
MDADTNGDGLPDGWFTWKPKGSEINSEVTQDGTLRITNPGKTRGGVATRKFSLKPEGKYVLEFKIKGQVKNEKNFTVYVLSEKGKHVQLQNSAVKAEANEKLFRYEFVTTKDIEDGKQYIRFDHGGNGDGYLEVLEVNLYKAQ